MSSASDSEKLIREKRSVTVGWLLKAALIFLAALAITVVCGQMREKKPAVKFNNPTATIISEDHHTAEPAAPPAVHSAHPTPAERPTSGLDKIRNCFQPTHILNDQIELLDDVLTAESRPSSNGSNIFFHETTCRDGIAQLGIRQACAIESAALANPNRDVYLLFASPVGFERAQPRPALYLALNEYSNVHWRNLNLWSYTQGTPAEQWMRRPDLFRSTYLGAHMADFLRLVSLYRFGGTHLDLDFVVRKSFDTLGANYAGEESKNVIENALLNFDANGIGHQIVKRSLVEFVSNYKPNEWSANGPQLVSRVLREMCKTEDLLECQIFKIHPKELFFSVYYTEWTMLFDPKQAEAALARVNGSYTVHLWNKMSAGQPVRLGANSAYEQLAKEYCPRVYESVKGVQF